MSLEHDRGAEQPDYLVEKFPADDVVTGIGYEQPLTPYHTPLVQREESPKEPAVANDTTKREIDQELLRLAEDDEDESETKPANPPASNESRPSWLDPKAATTHPPHSVATAAAYEK